MNQAKKILNQIGIEKETVNILQLDSYPKGTNIGHADPIFPRIEIKEKEYKEDLNIKNAITIDDFSKVKIAVVEILKAEKVEGSSRLLKFIVDTGNEKRQILSGISQYYPDPKILIGTKVLAVLNLEPVMLVGNISQGMLLTTEEKKLIKLITVEKSVKTGAKVK